MTEENKSVKNFPNSRNVPKLRFPEFTNNWKKYNLKEIAEKVNNKNNDNKIETVFSNSAVQGIVLQSDFFDKSIANKNNLNGYYIVEPFDFVYNPRLSSTAEVGAMSVNKTNLIGLVSPLYTVFTIKDKNINISFLEYLFKSKVWHNYMRSIANYGARDDRMNVRSDDFYNLPLVIPNFSEQIKVSKLLSLIESRIQTQKKIIEKLETLIKTSRENIFSQKLRFKDELGNYFHDWKLRKLGNFGMFFSGGTPLTSNRNYYKGNIPFIKSGEINAIKTEQFVSEEALKNSSAKMVNVGDILYALYGATSGEVGISKINGAINQAILCIRTELNSLFLLNYLKLKKENILNTYLQGGQGNLSSEIIKSLYIPVPDSAEQSKIANFLSSIQEKIETEKQILEKLELQKKFLLANLFV